jgi:hypothetical protein
MGGTGEWRRRTADLVTTAKSDLARRSGREGGEAAPAERENGQWLRQGNRAVRARGLRERERVRVEVASIVGWSEEIEVSAGGGWLAGFPPLLCARCCFIGGRGTARKEGVGEEGLTARLTAWATGHVRAATEREEVRRNERRGT